MISVYSPIQQENQGSHRGSTPSNPESHVWASFNAVGRAAMWFAASNRCGMGMHAEECMCVAAASELSRQLAQLEQ